MCELFFLAVLVVFANLNVKRHFLIQYENISHNFILWQYAPIHAHIALLLSATFNIVYRVYSVCRAYFFVCPTHTHTHRDLSEIEDDHKRLQPMSTRTNVKCVRAICHYKR